ncbi:hypothetical protein MBLNU457_4402t1 [Dothideomycetes sp. NU457]
MKKCQCPRKDTHVPPSPDIYLFPYINLEDLTKPKTLLVFLHTRGRNQPWKFALVDRYPDHSKALLKPDDKIRSRMYLLHRETPEKYGRILKVREDDTAAKYLEERSELVIDGTEGLQVLKVQSRILDFLLRCCHLILKDQKLEVADLERAPCSAAIPVEWPQSCSLTDLAVQAPYSLPQNIQLDRLSDLANSRFDFASDHVWTLRENPGYFAESLLDWGEHLNAHIRDEAGRPSPLLDDPKCYSWHATAMIIDAYGSALSWAKVVNILQMLTKTHENWRPQLDPTKPLGNVIEMAMCMLDALTKSMMEVQLDLLDAGFRSSPLLRDGYRMGKNGKLRIVVDSLNISKSERQMRLRIHKLLTMLFWVDNKERHGLGNIVEEIQTILDSTSDRLVGSWVAERFTDIAMLVEFQRQINRLEPWATVWRSKDLLDHQKTHPGCRNCPVIGDPTSHTLAKVAKAIHDTKTSVAFKTADPANFRYPSRNTSSTNAQIRLCEAKLDRFWRTVDKSLVQGYKTTTNGQYCPISHPAISDAYRKIQRTPLWVEPELPKPKIDQDPSIPYESSLPTSLNLAAEQTSQKADVLLALPIRRKVKTQGIANAPESLVKVKSPEQVNVLNPVRIGVSVRALRTFRALFHVSVADKGAGEIPWNDFLYAMAEVGFKVEKLMGSSWMFSPPASLKDTRKSAEKSVEDLDSNKENIKDGTVDQTVATPAVTSSLKPIQFHEPHPASKVGMWVARKMGRRLTGAYGWDGETFVQK